MGNGDSKSSPDNETNSRVASGQKNEKPAVCDSPRECHDSSNLGSLDEPKWV